MKKFAIIVILSLATIIGGYAQMLSQGTKEIEIEGSFDYKSPAGTQIWTALGFGYYVIDNFELMGVGYFSYDDYTIGIHPAIGAEYNFNLGYKLVPFVGVDLGWGIWDYKEAEDIDGFVYGFEAGLKYFIFENFALSVSADYDLSTADLWMEKGGNMVDTNWGVRWGLRYFFI